MKNDHKKIKKLIIWNFYVIHDGHKYGHPGLIIWKNDDKNIYIAIKFGTSNCKDNVLLKKQISKTRTNYIYKRLFIGKRKDFNENILKDFFITDEVISFIDKIKNNNFKYSKSVSKSQKKFIEYYKFIIIKEIKK